MAVRHHLRFEDPPQKPAKKVGGSKGKYQALLLRLKRHPHRWAVLAKLKNPLSAAGAASRLRKGHINAPAGKFEYTSRGTKVYGRYLGENEAPAT